MNAGRTVTVFLLLILFTGLGATLGIYAQIQRGIALEGNRLYSDEAARVTAAPADVVSLLAAEKVSARIYTPISGDDQVRAMFQVGGANDPLPVHEGRQFLAADTRVAMVGADVPVRVVGASSFYTVDGCDYLVIARLGLSENSLLSNDVLIKNDSYFEKDAAEDLVVDGAEAARAVARSLEPEAYASLSSGTNRRTNIDYVSPILLRFGWSLALLGSLATALLAARYVQHKNMIKDQLGHSRRKILADSTGQQLIRTAVAVVPAIVLSVVNARSGQPASPVVEAVLGQALLIVVVFAAVTARQIWSRPAWM